MFVGDLLNLYGESLDYIFERVFRACISGVNLQHFNRNSLVDNDFIQFMLEHTDFVDYVFSSRNVKFSDLQYKVLVGGVINWLNNFAQSNRQMDTDNDWAISLEVSRTSEIPRGFGKTDDFEPEIIKESRDSSVFTLQTLSVTVPRSCNDDMDILPGEEDEEERLFGLISNEEDQGNEDDDIVSEGGGEDYFDEDNGMVTVFKNKASFDVLIDKEIFVSNKITDYYELGKIQDTPLRGECLLIAIYAHHSTKN